MIGNDHWQLSGRLIRTIDDKVDELSAKRDIEIINSGNFDAFATAKTFEDLVVYVEINQANTSADWQYLLALKGVEEWFQPFTYLHVVTDLVSSQLIKITVTPTN